MEFSHLIDAKAYIAELEAIRRDILDAEPVAALIRLTKLIDEFDEVLETKPCPE